MKIEVGTVVNGIYPSLFTSEEKGQGAWRKDRKSTWDRELRVRPVVEWIHPKWRFAVIRFDFIDFGTCYRESVKLKTPQELVAR